MVVFAMVAGLALAGLACRLGWVAGAGEREPDAAACLLRIAGGGLLLALGIAALADGAWSGALLAGGVGGVVAAGPSNLWRMAAASMASPQPRETPPVEHAGAGPALTA